MSFFDAPFVERVALGRTGLRIFLRILLGGIEIEVKDFCEGLTDPAQKEFGGFAARVWIAKFRCIPGKGSSLLPEFTDARLTTGCEE
jgi:hypothetical protein